jgi:hypothetical protein
MAERCSFRWAACDEQFRGFDSMNADWGPALYPLSPTKYVNENYIRITTNASIQILRFYTILAFKFRLHMLVSAVGSIECLCEAVGVIEGLACCSASYCLPARTWASIRADRGFGRRRTACGFLVGMYAVWFHFAFADSRSRTRASSAAMRAAN